MDDCTPEQPHQHNEAIHDEWREGVLRALHDSGQRSTFPRRAIVDAIAQQARPFSAEELVALLETQAGWSSRATIYRLVEWLRAQGWLARVQRDNEHATYARLLPGHHHTAVCSQCGRTFVIGGCNVEEVLAPLLASAGFDVHGHVLELYGLCDRCRVGALDVGTT